MHFLEYVPNTKLFGTSINTPISSKDLEFYGIENLEFSEIVYNENNEPIAYIFEDENDKYHAFNINVKRFTKDEGYRKLVIKAGYLKSEVIAFWNNSPNTHSIDIYYKEKLIANKIINFNKVKDQNNKEYLAITNSSFLQDIFDLESQTYLAFNLAEVCNIHSKFRQVICKDEHDLYFVTDYNGNNITDYCSVDKLEFTDIENYYIMTTKNNKQGLIINDEIVIEPKYKKVIQVTKDKIVVKNTMNKIHIIQFNLINTVGYKWTFEQDNYKLQKDVINIYFIEDYPEYSILTIDITGLNLLDVLSNRKMILKDYLAFHNNDIEFKNHMYDEILYLGNGNLKFFKIDKNNKVEIEFNNSNLINSIYNQPSQIISKFHNDNYVRMIYGDNVLVNGMGKLYSLSGNRQFGDDFMTIPKKGLDNVYIFKDINDRVTLYNMNNGDWGGIQMGTLSPINIFNTIIPVFHNCYYNTKTNIYYNTKNYKKITESPDKCISLNHYLIILYPNQKGYLNGIKVFDENLKTVLTIPITNSWCYVDSIRRIVTLGNETEAYCFTNEFSFKHFHYYNLCIEGKKIYQNSYSEKDGLVLDTQYVDLNELELDIKSMLVSSEYKCLIPSK